MTPVQRVTILGDRASGRTCVLALIAVDEAVQGRHVLWETGHPQDVTRAVELIQRLAGDFVRSVRTGGAGGGLKFHGKGEIMFYAWRGTARPFDTPPLRSWRVDTHIADDVYTEGHPDATRIFKAVLR